MRSLRTARVVALFHLIAAGSALLSADWWRRPERCQVRLRRWRRAVGVHAAALAVGIYLLSLALTIAATYDKDEPGRLP